MVESQSLSGQTVSHYFILEMRFLDELSIEEIADVIDVSRTTVRREWATTRAWLRREMSRREERA